MITESFEHGGTTYYFGWVLSFMGTVEYEVADDTGTYRAEIRHSYSDYELSIANGDDVRMHIKESVGILRRHSCASPSDHSFEMPTATVAAFNAWRLARHLAFVAKLEAAPERYGVIAEDDPLRKPPMIAKRGRFERGHWVTEEPQAAAA